MQLAATSLSHASPKGAEEVDGAKGKSITKRKNGAPAYEVKKAFMINNENSVSNIGSRRVSTGKVHKGQGGGSKSTCLFCFFVWMYHV